MSDNNKLLKDKIKNDHNLDLPTQDGLFNVIPR